MSAPLQYWAVGSVGGTPRISERKHRTAMGAFRELNDRNADPCGLWAKPLGRNRLGTDVRSIDGWAPILPVAY